MSPRIVLIASLVLLALGIRVALVEAQRPPPGGRRAPAALAGTGFTYQGQLKNNGALVNGTCDFQFGLWDSLSSGTQITGTSTLNVNSLSVTNGLFTTPLDFGSSTFAFNGDARYLEISLRCPAGGGGYTTLSPRQALTPAPYALALPGLFTQQTTESPNVIGGFNGNSIAPGVVGATIGGGGSPVFGANVISGTNATYATISGGVNNAINGGNIYNSTIGGGVSNQILGPNSYRGTIGGGGDNVISGTNAYYATIGGGQQNTASGRNATIGGGYINTASGVAATIGGGQQNTASGVAATIGGGQQNTNSGNYATIGGGALNTASGIGAFIGGGGYDGTTARGNLASGNASTIGGGISNTITSTAPYATIGGGYGSTASGWNATVGGGGGNTASALNATVGGGGGNTASGIGATIGGGVVNTADGITATISGGQQNHASGTWAFIGGGAVNTASGGYATVGGGGSNTASGQNDTIGGGGSNYASGGFATIGGGNSNTASGGSATIGGGVLNSASGKGAFIGGGGYDGTNFNGNKASGNASTIGGGLGNTASGYAATVPGGYINAAQGNYSFAAGSQAQALHIGTFVWADFSGVPITSTASNQFLVRATGGISMATSSNLSSGCYIPGGGGAWTCTSDRNAKANLAAVDEREILAKLSNIPIQTWNYKTQDASIRHIGPMAQDFFAAFNVGEDNTHISTVDEGGVAFAAIQGLYQEVQEKDAEIGKLKAQNEKQQAKIESLDAQFASQRVEMDDLKTRFAALEQTQPSPHPLPNREREIGLALFIGAVGVIAIERARKGGAR